ncbi:hypothetical protein FACS1894102_1140 [Spirochaetia bacterium]|nr:hypothetical protein FACS1894102_1140 [Spirochaetia bacterium]
MKMNFYKIINPFNAPIHFLESCESTMNEAKKLLQGNKNISNGTLVITDFQSKGRGRINNRKWVSSAGENLLFTVILNDIGHTRAVKQDTFVINPLLETITLRVGLAVLDAICCAVPGLKKALRIKWPNDIMLNGKKVCGIISECDCNNILIGIGINVHQKNFFDMPDATSVENEMEACNMKASNADGEIIAAELKNDLRFVILEKFLSNLFMETANNETPEKPLKPVQDRINDLLYRKDSTICFMAGSAEYPKQVNGILRGINEKGHIQIEVESGKCSTFAAGEIWHKV